MRSYLPVASLLVLAVVALVLGAAGGVHASAGSQALVVEYKEPPLLQVGVHIGSTPFHGITIKKRAGDGLMVQGLLRLDDRQASLAGRLLFDLGRRGEVFRYMGLGLGAAYAMPGYEWSLSGHKLGVGFTGFIGVDYPLSWFGQRTPFSTNLEAVVSGVNKSGDGTAALSARTGVDIGFSYWF